MKLNLVNEVASLLEDAGYSVIDCRGLQSCFDLIAKRGRLLFIKVISNVDGLTRRASLELQNAASCTSAIPLVVGDHTKSSKLLDGVVYERYGARIVNIETLREVIYEKPPMVYSVRGNYCIRIDSSLMVKLRKKLDLTQEELARRLGVSKQTVHRYEFSGRISRSVAERLMRFLDEDIFIPEKVFVEPKESEHLLQNEDAGYGGSFLKLRVLSKFRELGFRAELTHAPFDIVASDSDSKRILTAVSDDPRRLNIRLALIERVCDLVGGYGMCVSNRGSGYDVPVIRPRKLWRVHDPEELFALLNE